MDKKILEIEKIGETSKNFIFKVSEQNFDEMEDFRYKNVILKTGDIPEIIENLGKDIVFYLRRKNHHDFLLSCSPISYLAISEAIKAFNKEQQAIHLKKSLDKVKINLFEWNNIANLDFNKFLNNLNDIKEIEEFRTLKFKYLADHVYNLPISTKYCLDCIVLNRNEVGKSHVCDFCNFGRKYGRCSNDVNSSYQKMLNARTNFIKSLENLYK